MERLRRKLLSLIDWYIEKPETSPIDNQTAIRFKRKLAAEFREQLVQTIPSNQEEATLRRLAQQLRDKKVVIKLFLKSPLHAKLEPKLEKAIDAIYSL